MRLFLACVLFCCQLALCSKAGDAALTNLVSNPGFELKNDKGQAVSWRLPAPEYGLSGDSARSGDACLTCTNTNSHKYILASAPIQLVPGRCYEVEAWVRTKGLKGGEGGGATICMEWNDGKGGFLGGVYPHGITGTHADWQKVNAISAAIPSNAARFNVTCYLRRGATGTAWWDDISVREFRPPLISVMTTDCYRNQSTGGVIKVSAGLALTAHGLTTDDVTIDVSAKDGSGAQSASGSVVSVTPDVVSARMDVSPLKPGRYQVLCSARNKAGATIACCTNSLEKLSAFPERKAYVDSFGRLILDGKPFFPLGTYWGAVLAADLAIYSKSPFNCIMPYADIRRAGVDLAWSNGVRVIYSVKDFYPGHSGLKTSAEARKRITERINELKDHPGIIAWYINDELPITMVDELSAHRDWIEELDPGRPAWSVLYQVDQMRLYLPTFDIAGADPYPIPGKPVSMALDWTLKTRAATFGSRAVWMVPQIFNWGSYKEGKEKEKGRAPTLAEMRCMAWSCIAAGANGLIFYSWFDLLRMDKTREDGGRAAVRDPFDERWKDVCTMAGEIRDRIPILLSVDPVPVLQVNAPSDVAVGTRVMAGNIFLVVVNNSASETITLPVGFPAGVVQAGRDLGDAVAEGSGKDWKMKLPPMSVSILKFKQ
jgi:hypothetical protein